MTSSSSDSRRSMSRRDSSRSNSQKRPRLMRACATEPSITTSNASRGALASPQSSRRATDLLNQVAYVSGSAPDTPYSRSSASSTNQSPAYDSTSIMSTSPASRRESLDELRCHHDSGRYYSFPSFDTWDIGEQKEEDEDEKSP